MMFDEEFWVAVAIILFAALVFKYIRNWLKETLNQRSSLIQNKISEALSLSEEAEKLLQEQNKLYESSTQEAEELLVLAEKEVANLKDTAEKELEERLSLQTDIITTRISNNEHKLLNKLRLESVQLAIATSMAILNETKSNKVSEKLVKDSIDTISNKLTRLSVKA
jgi:F-type H+-transporting ATPase subunit b